MRETLRCSMTEALHVTLQNTHLFRIQANIQVPSSRDFKRLLVLQKLIIIEL